MTNMTQQVTIRPARVGDAPALARLRYDFRAARGVPSEPELAFLTRCEQWMETRLASSDRWQCWIALAGPRIVGAL